MRQIRPEPQQREAIRNRNVLQLIEAGGNAYYLAKFAGIFGLDMQDIGAQQTGLTKDEFKAKLLRRGDRSWQHCRYHHHFACARDHAKSHADIAHPDWMFDKTPLGPLKRKGWCTPYGFGDWKEPISYEDACEQMKAMVATIKWPEPKTE